MKKFLAIMLMALFCFTFVACGDSDNNSQIDTNTKFSQEVTIVKMPSPPRYKTSNNASIVNEVIKVLGEIEKAPMTCGNTNGWHFLLKINIDGQELNYSIGSDAFTDSDGKQYTITNFSYIKEKIMKIYDGISAAEVDYS